MDKNHEWHITEIAAICAADKQLLMATPYKIVDLENKESFDDAVNWWIQLTEKGGEGMVVKPYNFIAAKMSDFKS